MARVKGGYTTRQRRKKVLKLAKGYYGAKHILYKTAHEQVMHSFKYAYNDRKDLKRNMRKLWIDVYKRQRCISSCWLREWKMRNRPPLSVHVPAAIFRDIIMHRRCRRSRSTVCWYRNKRRCRDDIFSFGERLYVCF